MSEPSVKASSKFRHWIKALDRILRGEATSLKSLRNGVIRIPTGGLLVVLTGLASIYGFCMGWFGMFNGAPYAGLAQLASSAVKLPLLFF